MHGEAWVNHAIQEADLLHRARHALRRPRHGQPQDLRAANARKIHVDIDRAELNKNVRVDVGDRQGSARPRSSNGCRTSRAGIAPNGSRGSTRSRAIRRCATSSSCPTTVTSTPRTSSTICGALTEGNADRRHRRRPASDVGGAALPSTSGRGRSSRRAVSARWASRCRRRSAPASRARTPRSGSVVGDGGFQMTMCELATIAQEELDVNIAIINNGYLGMVRQWQEFFYEQPLRGDAADGSALREARRRVRHRGDDGRRRGRRGDAVHAARRSTGPVVIDFRRRAGRLRSTRWCRPARISTRDDPAAQSPIVETAAD